MTVQEEHDSVCVKLVREMTIEDLESLRAHPWTQPGRILLLLRVVIAGRVAMEDEEPFEEQESGEERARRLARERKARSRRKTA